MTELSTRDLAVRVLRQQRTAMMAMLGEALDCRTHSDERSGTRFATQPSLRIKTERDSGDR
jgi:hypothetical protein